MEVGDHPRVCTPDEKSQIWRYIDLTQLISLLSRRSLFFSRADGFEDEYEGALPERTRERRDKTLSGISNKITQEFIPEISRGLTQYTYINCWHTKETESAVMWDLTSTEKVGVCIESTVGRLRDAIEHPTSDMDDVVYIHRVKYRDYETFDIPDWNPLNIDDYLPPYLYKRLEFAEENELRAIIQRKPGGALKQTYDGPEIYIGDNQEDVGVEADNPKGGISVPINFGILCSRIHISENVPEWKVEILRRLVEDYLEDEEYEIPVEKSSVHEATPKF